MKNGECIKEEVFIKRSIILRVCCKCCTHIQSIIYDRYIMLMLHAPLLLTQIDWLVKVCYINSCVTHYRIVSS